LIVVVTEKRLEQQNTVEALNGERNALKKEGRFFIIFDLCVLSAIHFDCHSMSRITVKVGLIDPCSRVH